MHRVIVVGSPRPEGRSAALANELFCAYIDECPDDGVSIVSAASVEVAPCLGCDACSEATAPPEPLEEGDPLSPCAAVVASTAATHRCVIADEMGEVRKHLDAADELVVVCPVYFAGAPAQMKALMDRLQPYYFSDLRRQPKRPCVLHVVGEGGDPHGFEPLIGELRSAFGVAGFQLELVLDWVGKIDASGEIVAEAEEYPIPPLGGFGALEGSAGAEAADGSEAQAVPPAAACEAPAGDVGAAGEAQGPSGRSAPRERLDLGAAGGAKGKGGSSSAKARGAKGAKGKGGAAGKPAKGAKRRG